MTLPDGTIESSAPWFAAAARRAELIDKYCWNDEDSLYYDYDIVEERQSTYQSVTSVFALWAGHVSQDKAERLMYAGKAFSHERRGSIGQYFIGPYCTMLSTLCRGHMV